jgi:lysine 2,3-aminomutase
MNDWQDSFRQAQKISREGNYLPSQFKTLITPFIAEKIKKFGVDSPIGKQFAPSELEEDPQFTKDGLKDPIADEKYLVAPGLIHRYANRALYIPTSVCPVHCRYCFRRNEIQEQGSIFEKDIVAAKNYLTAHPEIEEIIFTGGDPLSLSTPKLEEILNHLSEIESIRYIRFHTRFASTMPERIDDEFISLLIRAQKLFKKINFVIHINSPLEICDEVERVLLRLANTGVNLLSQTVLLKEVNDNPNDLTLLFKTLADLGVRPYYLHHADKVFGATHFQTSLKQGRLIYHEVRKRLSGWMIPEYVIDLPSGGGKVPAYNSESFEFSGQLINRFAIPEQYH